MIGLNETAIIYDKSGKRLCMIRSRIIRAKDITTNYDSISPFVDWTLQIITDWNIPNLYFSDTDKEVGQYKCEINNIFYVIQAISKYNPQLTRGNQKAQNISILTLK